MTPLKQSLSSWARTKASQCFTYQPHSASEMQAIMQQAHQSGVIAYGKGLNYGDQAFNTFGNVIITRQMNRILDFNNESGELVCEPGVNFFDILNTYLAQGWGPPVIPGSLYVTLGGAVANDVHGKEHHHSGSFGQHIKWLELITQGETWRISNAQHAELFQATVGGLGLTGIISKLCLQLKPMTNFVNVEHLAKHNWQDLLAHLIEVSSHSDYAIAWMDLCKLYRNKGRGIITTASYAPYLLSPPATFIRAKIPLQLPFSVINNSSIQLFNHLYFRQTFSKGKKEQQHLLNFINPLDKISNWNYLYGPKGLVQFQCCFSFETASLALKELLELFEKHAASAALAVIKVFGQSSGGLLSFASPGITIAIDFPYRVHNIKAIKAAHAVVKHYGGKVYLAKDNLLEAHDFQYMYPNYQRFNQIRQQYGVFEGFQSDMSRRLGLS